MNKELEDLLSKIQTLSDEQLDNVCYELNDVVRDLDRPSDVVPTIRRFFRVVQRTAEWADKLEDLT